MSSFRKFLCIFCTAAFTFLTAVPSTPLEMQVITLGMLEKLNSTEESFTEEWKKSFAPNNELLDVRVKFYSNLNALQMALNAGEIKHMVLPEPSAEYLMNQTSEYESVLVLRSSGVGLAFGFREDSKALRDSFNEALNAMRKNWTLPAIEAMYTASPGKDDPKPVEFAKFEGADTIRAAVTGDLPPIDFIAADGTPAGFNTAVLAEIGKYLGKNIELINVDAGARTAALASGRADVVFWYEVVKNSKYQHDVPEGVIVSEPYYDIDKFIHLRKKLSDGNSWGWNIFSKDFLDFYIHN
ncbi:MAG: transporter substrate-binding domain-containing protein [Synergistaceae bacterium]|nr:transporter substrate-binding domain-containing protein [Synergistaceae bacterium]